MNLLTPTPAITLTAHAQKRMSQRGITAEMIFDTMEFGTCIRKQQICYYVMRRKNLQNAFAPHYAEQILNCVVVEAWTGDVLTVYKNSAAYHSIRKKTKYSTAMYDRHIALHGRSTNMHKLKVQRCETEVLDITPASILENPKLLHFGHRAGRKMDALGLSKNDLLPVLEFGRKRKEKNGCLRFTMRGSGGALVMPQMQRRLLNGLSLILSPDGKVINLKYLRKSAECITFTLPFADRNISAAA